MKVSDWDEIKHFHAGENWGDWSKMSFEFLKILDTVRHLADTPFELTSPAWTPKGHHSSASYHYIGRAADFRLPKKTLWEAYDLLVTTLEDMGIYPKVGFGFYPWGNFFHLDDRAERPGVGYRPGIIWVRPDESKPKYYLYAGDCVDYIAKIRQGAGQ